MPVSRLSTWEEVVVLWFSVSVAIQILSGVALWLWLVIHEVKVTFVFVGFPGYVERCYMQWRRSQGRSYRLVISLRIASAANTIAAALIALPILVGPQPGHNAEVEVSSLSLSLSLTSNSITKLAGFPSTSIRYVTVFGYYKSLSASE
jgi:hypothetical protein